jgi:hypothetical protein
MASFVMRARRDRQNALTQRQPDATLRIDAR